VRRELDGLVRQLARFATVGIANTALSYVVYVALVHLDVPAPVAGAVAFAAGAVLGYVFNGRWTFSGSDTGRQRLRYLLVQLAGAGTTSAVVWLATTVGVPRTVAYLVAVPPVTLTTFFLNRSWVFVGSDTAPSETEADGATEHSTRDVERSLSAVAGRLPASSGE